jgi:hypothetical protein
MAPNYLYRVLPPLAEQGQIRRARAGTPLLRRRHCLELIRNASFSVIAPPRLNCSRKPRWNRPGRGVPPDIDRAQIWGDLEQHGETTALCVGRQWYRGRLKVPKTEADRRTVTLPAGLAAKSWAIGADRAGHMFTTRTGVPPGGPQPGAGCLSGRPRARACRASRTTRWARHTRFARRGLDNLRGVRAARIQHPGDQDVGVRPPYAGPAS